MEQTKEKKKIKDFSSYFIVVAFLALEVVAFLSFSLGFSYLLYGILGLVLLALLILVTLKEITFDGVVRTAIFAFPLLIFGLLTAVSIFTKYCNQYGSMPLADVVFIPISLTVFAFIGYFLSLNNKFKISILMTVIFASLAVYCLINLIATLAQFGPFYPILHGESKFYYGGVISPAIKNIAYALIGFQITEVSILFYSLFPTILLVSSLGLFFISPKNNTRLFVAYVAFSLVGFLSLLFTLNLTVGITDALLIIVLALVVLYIKFNNPTLKKVYKTVFIVLVVLICLGFLAVFFNAQKNWTASIIVNYRNFIASNSFLNRLFNTNRIIKPINECLCDIFTFGQNGKFFGFYLTDPIHSTGAVVSSTGIFLIDNLASSGVFGAILFLVFLIVGLKAVLRFFNSDKFSLRERALAATFVIVYFVYICINNVFDITIFVSVKTSFYMQGIFLVICLLIGYCYSVTAKEVKQDETKQIEETQSV